MRKSDRLLSSTRRTQFSPQIVATVETRMSISRSSTTMVICPSWGRRRSTMFMLAMIFKPAHECGRHRQRQVHGVVQRAVDAVPDSQVVPLRLDVDVRRPVAHRLGDEEVDDLDDRGVVGHGHLHAGVGGGSARALGGLLEGTDVLLDVAERPVGGVDGALDVGSRRDDEPDDLAARIGQDLGQLGIRVRHRHGEPVRRRGRGARPDGCGTRSRA